MTRLETLATQAMRNWWPSWREGSSPEKEGGGLIRGGA